MSAPRCDIPGCENAPIAHEGDYFYWTVCDEHMEPGDRLFRALEAVSRAYPKMEELKKPRSGPRLIRYWRYLRRLRRELAETGRSYQLTRRFKRLVWKLSARKDGIIR